MSKISLKKALIINFTSKYANIVLSIVFSAILSRILTPNDFGIVAVITVFIVFFDLIADIGMGTAVVQDKTLSHDEINNIFSFSVYIAIILTITFCLFGFPLAWFYQNTVYKPITCILSVALFFQTAGMIPNAILRRKKKFLVIGIRNIIVALGVYIITIIFALMGMKYYALVLQAVFSSLFLFMWNIKTTKLKFIKNVNFDYIRKISNYSNYQFGFNCINYFARNLDKLIIGKFMGNVSLGQYDRAYRMMWYPVGNLTGIIASTLHPVLSDHQKNKEFIYIKYLEILKLLSLLGVFITPVCFWCSKEIIVLVFGNQWIEAAMCFKWMALAIWSQMVASSAGSIYQSIGNTKLMFTSALIHVPVLILCIFLGVLSGSLEMLSLVVACGFIIKFFIEFWFLIDRGFSKNILKFFIKFVPDISIGIIVFLGLLIFEKFIDTSKYIIISLIIKLFFSVLIYFVCLLIFRQYKYIKKLFS
jgi:PST family polysaccharide transporter